MNSIPPRSDQNRHAHGLRNILHSVVLIAGLALLMSVCAWILSGWSGILWGLAGAGLSLLLGQRASPAVAMRMFRAKPLDRETAPALIGAIEELSRRARLPAVPRLNLLPSATLTAFAVGKPDDAAIALSSGLLEKLSPREVAGVLAHEVSHIANNDLWIMGLADTFSRMTQILSWIGVMLLVFNLPAVLAGGQGVPWIAIGLLYFAPTIGSLLQLALSRNREYDADLAGAEMCGDPEALASALEKLERHQGRMWEDMFPTGRKIPVPSVFRSHPPTADRVERLRKLARTEPAYPPLRPAAPTQVFGFGPLRPNPRFYWPGVWF